MLLSGGPLQFIVFQISEGLNHEAGTRAMHQYIVIRSIAEMMWKVLVPESFILAGKLRLNDSNDVLQRRRVILAQLLPRIYQEVDQISDEKYKDTITYF